MMTAIRAACEAFGLTFSEAKTEIVCPRDEIWRGRVVQRHSSRPGVYKKRSRLCTLKGGGYQLEYRSVEFSFEVIRRLQRTWPSYGRYTTTAWGCAHAVEGAPAER